MCYFNIACETRSTDFTTHHMRGATNLFVLLLTYSISSPVLGVMYSVSDASNDGLPFCAETWTEIMNA